jgi:thymidylate synthase (FAD)
VIEFDSKMGVELIKTNANDDDVALAAWVSNNMDSVERLENRDRVKGLINFLYREQHMSPFEHGSFTFKVDCPIFVTREFQRHRTWSYNEVSGRYTEMKPRFYIPSTERPIIQQGKIGKYYFTPGTEDQVAVARRMDQVAYEAAWNSYQAKLNIGCAREVARNVLPLALYTQFYATANPRNVMQFLILRTAPNALYEIREVAEQIEAHFAEAMPLTYDIYKETRTRLADDKHFEKMFNDMVEEYNKLLEENLEIKQELYDLRRMENEGGE